MTNLIKRTLEKIFLKFKIGEISFSESKSEPSEDHRLALGYVEGVLVRDERTQETYIYSDHDQEFYYTYSEYGIWAGAVVEFKPISDESLTLEFKGKLVKGWAYEVSIRSLGSGKLYELPDPEELRSLPLSSFRCPCPFCIIEALDSK